MSESEHIFSCDDFSTELTYPSELLFLSKRFLRVQENTPKLQFSIVHRNKLFLTLTFSLINDFAASPYKAPFGGPNEIEEIPKEVILSFIGFLQHELKMRGVNLISISFPANCYNSRSEVYVKTFLSSGWNIDYSDVGLFLKLRDNNGYWKGLDAGSRNRLNKAKKAGFYTEKLSYESLDDAYQIVVSNRLQNNYPITMTRDALHFMLKNFEEYELFGVFYNEDMVAMAVCIKVSDAASYLFYLADLNAYRNYSPNVLLLNYIYDYYFSLGCELLDLGVVSESSIINKGLFTFKRNLGGIPSKKYTLQKKL